RTIVDSEADAVLIGGDIAEAEDIELWLLFLEEWLQRPIYFVLGNHDYYRGSIIQVRSRVEKLASNSRWLCWLDREAVIRLTENTCLIGHGGWGDGRFGDYKNSRVFLNDFIYIKELAGLDQETLRERLASLGDEAALHLHRILPEALHNFSNIVLLTHVPPFKESCWHEGRISDDNWLPHFTCKAVGDLILEFMQANPARSMNV